MSVKKRKAKHVTPKKKDIELPCLEVAKEITRWSAADVVRSPASFALHPALEKVGFEKAGAHSFRRIRNTYLRNFTSCTESVRNFWLGWGSEGMSAHYDGIRDDVAYRRDVA